MSYQNIFITPSTSLVLIKNLATPANVYLSTFYIPDFKVTIRDTTGLASSTNPVTISTTGGASFTDGTSEYILNNPYGLVNLSLRTSTTWQVLHTSGQDPAQSAANVNTINISTAYFDVQSTSQLVVSTFTVENLITPNAISITGPFVITNLSTPGFVLIGSTLNVYGDVKQEGNLYVSGSTRFLSSASVLDISTLTYPIYISSSLGVAGPSFVGGTTDVGSTLTLQSTAQVSTLRVLQQTSDDILTVFGDAFFGNDISHESTLAVGLSTFGRGPYTIYQDVSSIQGNLTTSQVNVQQNLRISSNVSTLGSLVFEDDTYVQRDLRAQQGVTVQGNASLFENLYTSSFFTSNLSTTGHVSTTGPFTILSSVIILGNVSTTYLSSGQLFSVGQDLILQTSLTSLQGFTVTNDLDVFGRADLDDVVVNGAVGVGNNANIISRVYANEAVFNSNVSVGGFITAMGYSYFSSSVSSRNTVSVSGNMTVYGVTNVSSLGGVNSFLLSNLEVTTSSPYITLQAESMNASTIISETFHLRAEGVSTGILYTSSLFADSFLLYSTIIDNITTSTFRFGIPVGGYDESVKSKAMYVNRPSYFLEGFSSLSIRSDTIQANQFEGSFVGDGFNVTNISNPYLYLSAPFLVASTITANEIYTSSTKLLGYINLDNTQIVSSLKSDYFYILPQGYPTQTAFLVEENGGLERRDVNTMVAITSNQMAINNALFFDQAQRYAGIGISTPQYDLDISGGIYCTNLYYSSINAFSFSTNTIGFNVLQTSSAIVRDYFGFGEYQPTSNSFLTNGGILFPVLYFTSNISAVAWQIQRVSSVNGALGIYDNYLYSSIQIGNAFIRNDSQTVAIAVDPVTQPIFTQTPEAELQLYTEFSNYSLPTGFTLGLRSTEIRTSTATVSQTLTTTVLHLPNLYMYGASSPTTNVTTNRITNSFSTITFDDIMTVQLSMGENLQGRNVGIKTQAPSQNLEIMGNAYFSSLRTVNLRASTISFNLQTL